MKLHTLKPAAGAVKKRKRIARGIGSGHGRTATRGHKGDKSRSGRKKKRNFEGGQMPIQMRLPKIGFKNINRVTFTPINLERLELIASKYNIEVITPEELVAKGVVSKNDKVKVLGGGEFSSKLSVTAHAFSASAKEAIESCGGNFTLLES